MSLPSSISKLFFPSLSLGAPSSGDLSFFASMVRGRLNSSIHLTVGGRLHFFFVLLPKNCLSACVCVKYHDMDGSRMEKKQPQLLPKKTLLSFGFAFWMCKYCPTAALENMVGEITTWARTNQYPKYRAFHRDSRGKRLRPDRWLRLGYGAMGHSGWLGAV